MKNNDPRYPIGKFKLDVLPTAEERSNLIADIEKAPSALRSAVSGLAPQQIETPYREGGWTVQQVIHHVPDSHMNAYIRFKLALTEDDPTIKRYEEARWAELEDSLSTPIEVSLSLMDSLHHRWVRVLRSIQPEEWKRTLCHPEMGTLTLDKMLILYAWHGKHHVAHITELRKHKGW
jgi:DinB family protein